jgi:hypothetical protein
MKVQRFLFVHFLQVFLTSFLREEGKTLATPKTRDVGVAREKGNTEQMLFSVCFFCERIVLKWFYLCASLRA